MTDEKKVTTAVNEDKVSIGFLNASEKMFISTFDIPMIFLEDLGFSKKRIGKMRDFNRRFITGFYGKVRGAGDKLSFKSKTAPQAKAVPEKTKVADAPSQAAH